MKLLNSLNIFIKLILYFFLPLLISCSNAEMGSWITHSPTNEYQLGLLVDHAPESEIQNLVQEKKLSARVLSKDSGTYEVYGMPESELKKELPGVTVEQNQFFQNYEVSKSPLKPNSSDTENNLGATSIQEDPTLHLKIIGAEKAWQYAKTKGEHSIVAIIDNGLNYQLKSFEQKIKVNENDPINEFDDDQNGFIDDYYGWNFGENNADLTDISHHGTSVSSIVNDDTIGVAPNAKIIPLKVVNKDNKIDEGTVIAALKYVANHTSAKIINMSIGKMHVSPLFNRTLGELNKLGIIIIAATGDNGLNCAQIPTYPASSNFPNTMSIGASVLSLTNPFQLASYSNYGNCVDLLAPAGDFDKGILTPRFNFNSTKAEGNSVNSINAAPEVFSGNSAAAPMVSGVAALALSVNPNLKPSELKQILLESGVSKFKNTSLSKKGIINALNAVQKAKKFKKSSLKK